jgi:hypothetical protein
MSGISFLADISASKKIYQATCYNRTMRRLIIEFSQKDVSKFHEPGLLEHLKTFEVIQFLRLDNEEFAAVCRIETKDGSPEFEKEDVVRGFFEGAQLLEREKNGASIVFIKHNIVPFGLSINQLIGGGYLVAAEIREEKMKITLLGSVKQVKSILATLRQSGVRYSILSLTDAKFSLDSPLNALTEKQRRVLIASYKSGYYSLPRKTSSEKLAKKLNLHKSALATHRRKAELRLITQILKEQT